MRSFTNRQLFQKFLAPTSDSPLALEIVKAKGIYLYDKEGKSYIDLISGIAVSNVGHRNKKIISAIKKDPPTTAPSVRLLGRVSEFNGVPLDFKRYASRDAAKTAAENALIVA